MRDAEIERNTNETKISAKLAFYDNSDTVNATSGVIDTGVGFLDHMLCLFEKHGGFKLDVTCKGDIAVDCHHTVEDVGIVIGKMLRQLIGDGSGLARYGDAVIPMDEVLCRATVDISGRPFLVFNAPILSGSLGNYEAEITEDFFRAVAFNAGLTLHINVEYGKNTHHIIEAMFKAFAHAINAAMTVRAGRGDVLSTKGSL